jgi:hypothetical protein
MIAPSAIDRVAPTLRRLAWGGLLALLVLALAAARSPRASASEAGVNLTNSNPVEISDVKALGTHWVRMFATWPDLEPTRGNYDPFWFENIERMLAALPPGTKMILDVVNTPSWETGSSDEHTPPANPHEYAALLGMLAQRFAGRIAAYEIWNEENIPSWWSGGPNPAAYTQLLQATYPAIKAADPNATVVLGGMAGNDYQFLEGVYAAGGKGSFDAVGVHTDTACNKLSPYEFLRGADSRLVPDSFLAYHEVHSVMLANGDEKPIWMTELSWRTTQAPCAEGAWAGQTAAGVTEQQQTTYLKQAYNCLAQDSYVQVALWFAVQDDGAAVSGLVRENGQRKPSFAAMRSYASEGNSLNEPCGNFTGPKIAVASPTNRSHYSGPLSIHVFATSAAGVFRIKLEIDGKLIRNYDGATYPTNLSGAIEWQHAKHISYGWHTLMILAYDRQRNVSRTSIQIYHAPPRRARKHGKHRKG